MKKLLAVVVLLLCGCAGRVAGTASWVQPPSQKPPQWYYQFPTGPLLGRVVQNADGSWQAYGCNGKNQSNVVSLAYAEQAVVNSCANANARKQ
jgi:hypothetical protein